MIDVLMKVKYHSARRRKKVYRYCLSSPLQGLCWTLQQGVEKNIEGPGDRTEVYSTAVRSDVNNDIAVYVARTTLY